MDDSEPVFAPVPVRARRDGWTPERQRAFILALRETRSVATAAAKVGMARETAYRLRERPGAAEFAAAWDAALAPLAKPIDGSRSIDGIVVPLMFRGKQIGWKRKIDRRVLFNVLRAHIALNGRLDLIR